MGEHGVFGLGLGQVGDEVTNHYTTTRELVLERLQSIILGYVSAIRDLSASRILSQDQTDLRVGHRTWTI